MDDALQAYDAGRADGCAGRHDTARAGEPGTGADYLVGIADGQMSAFEVNLLTAVQEALDGTNGAVGRSSAPLAGSSGAFGGDNEPRDGDNEPLDGTNEAR